MDSEQLFEMLEQALENESLPEDEAMEIMSKLSRGVNELDMEELDDLSVAQSDMQSMYSESEASYNPNLRGNTTVQLPAYKTPYEVWEEKHKGGKQRAKATVTLTKQREKDLISRLNESGRKKQELLALQQHKQIAEEIKNASFAPNINKKSRELNEQNQVKSLPERQDALLANRDAALKKQREGKVEKELKHMQDMPNVAASHQSWARIKRKQNLMFNDKANEGRTVHDLLRYGEDKSLRASERRNIAHQEEDREATFHPQINQHSVRLHERMMRQGRDVRRDQPKRSGKKKVVVGGTGTAHDPGHEEEVFKPKINPRSRAVPTDKTSGPDAYSRLYNQGMESTMRKRAKEAEVIDQHVTGVPGVGTAPPLSMRTQEFSQSRRHGAAAGNVLTRAGGMDDDEDAMHAIDMAQMSDVTAVLGAKPSALIGGQFGAATSSVSTFTAVDYNPKMAFIFTLFDENFPADE